MSLRLRPPPRPPAQHGHTTVEQQRACDLCTAAPGVMVYCIQLASYTDGWEGLDPVVFGPPCRVTPL